MKPRSIVLVGITSVWMSLARPCPAQPIVPAPPPAAPANAPGSGDASHLPSWLRVGFEYRGRAETGFAAPENRPMYLNRLRVSASVQPAGWLRIFVEGQDARAWGFAGAAFKDRQDSFDLHQAYAALGHAEQGWQLRFGRQELAAGDERLVAADSYWDWYGQSFDALRISWASIRWQAAAFAGFRTQPALRRPNPFDTASRIAGIVLDLKRDWGTIEPYLMWKRGSDVRDLMDRPGHKDVVTPGLLIRGDLPRRLDFDVEMALERGHVVGDVLSAWAGHWELGWRPWGKKTGPRLGVEYNYASGDADPAEGRHQTFDDLYPAGYNSFGMEDPIAWRNITYPFVRIEVPVTKRWTILGGYRWYWLAQVRDGLYLGGDDFVTRDEAATSSHVGSQGLLAVAYAPGGRWRLYAGYGRFFAGAYLRQAGQPVPSETFYVQPSYTF